MRKRSPYWLIAFLLLGLAALVPLCRAQMPKTKAAPRTAPAAQTPTAAAPIPPDLEVKRLILKDGSYQPIMKYEIKGDRVRYQSAERYDWEEIPTSLIDWAATEKYAREGGKPQVSKEAQELDAEEQAEKKKEDALTPLVAPGLHLPLQGGVFLLDVYNNQAQLVEVVQNSGEVNKNTGGNILRATINPLSSAKQTIELKGLHARVQSHVTNPYVYINIDEDQEAGNGPKAQIAKDHFRIVRVDVDKKKNLRVVGNIKVAIYGKVSQSEKFVPANAEVFSGPWIKVTPAEPLEPGEYALVEMLGDKDMNLFVWDFGVDPKAPANPTAWKPEPVKPNLTGTDKSPVLDKRK